MIGTCQTSSGEAICTEPFEDRIDILFRELELAIKWQRPSVLLSIFSSEYVRADADIALENRLHELGQSVHHIKVKGQDDADVSLMISELADLSNVVFFVDGLRWGGGEDDFNAYRTLNNRREFFIENQVRVIFWLTENEAIDLAHYAPDYWAFRHRVIEFVDSPKPEQISPRVLESAWQEIAEFIDTTEDLDAKIALRTALLTDLPEGNESTAARANLLLTLGMLHWRRGDYERATQFLNTALDLAARLQDNCFEALCFNAIALVKTDLGRTKEAIQAYQNAIELAPEQISPWNNLGNLYRKLEQHEEALAAFQKAIEQNATDVVSWNGLGDLYHILGRYDDAIYAFLKATELSPDYALSWSGLGTSYTNEGRLDDALAAHQKALEIDRRTINSWLGLGDIYRLQENSENAKMAYQTAIEIDPKNARAWNELGIVCYNTGAYDEAIRAYNKAIELDYDCGQLYSNLATIYVNQGRLAEVIPLLQKGIKLSDNAVDKALLWNRLGDAYRKLDDYNNAVAAYRKADELDPGTVHPKDVPSQAEANSDPVVPTKNDSANPTVNNEPEVSQGKPPTSEPANPVIVCTTNEVHVANDAEPVSPKSDIEFAEWLDKLGNISSTSAQPEERSATGQGSMEMAHVGETETVPEAPSTADEPTSPAEEDAPNSPEPAPVILGSQIPSDTPAEDDASESIDPAIESGQIEKADVTTDTELETGKASHSAPANIDDSVLQSDAPEDKINDQSQANTDAKNAQIWNELGGIYLNTGAYDEAIQAFSKATELDPSYGWPYNNLASIYFQKGRYSEAALLYQKAVRLLGETKEKALLWNRLGDTYRRLNERNNAAVAYQKAAELDPDHVSLLTRARLSLLGNHRA
jgi:tetratricopeptide (TPR) repeat protein